MPQIIGIDTSNLREAVNEAMKYSGRVPTVAASTAGFYIARKACNTARRASMSDIDQSLGVEMAPMLITRKGAKFGQPYKNKKMRVIVPDKSLAMWIVLARMKAGSDVNVAENNRYLLDRATFSPGAGTEGFWAAVKAYAVRMVSARHKSIAFLASSMVPVIKDLEPYVAPKYRRGMPPKDSQAEAAAKLSDTPKGSATVEASGYTATMTASALIGVNATPDNLSEQHNAAMWRWLAPAIQGAVYDETAKSLTYAAIQGELEERRAKFASNGVALA